MPNPAIKFYLQGAGAEQAAQDLARFLGQEYDTTPAVHNNASSADAGEPRRIDPATGIALAGLVLSIPGAILAAVDLADRIKKRKKADRLIQWARQKRQSSPQLQIHIEIGQAFLSLDKVDNAQLLDAMPNKESNSQL